MALTATQMALVLFKKLQGKGSSNDTREFFEEPQDGRASVLSIDIWQQADLIPDTAPALADTAISGVVQYLADRDLAAVAGTTNSFYLVDLKDAIPFNFGDGSYNYSLKDSTGTAIPFGSGDWLVDREAGLVTFYGATPANMPPKISFYKYIGTKGVGSGSGSSAVSWSRDTFTGDGVTTAFTLADDPGDGAMAFVTIGGVDQPLGWSITGGDIVFDDAPPADAIDPVNISVSYNIPIETTTGDPNAVLVDGTRAMTAPLDMGGSNVINVADPINDQDAATKAYVTLAVSANIDALRFMSWATLYPVVNASNPWMDIAYSPELNMFVAVGSSTVMTSENGGFSWTARTCVSAAWKGVAWSPDLGLFVAVASGLAFMSSPDGITWTSRAVPINNTWKRIAWGNGKFVAVSSSAGTGVAYSSDGITWTCINPWSVSWEDICWAEELGLFVAVSDTTASTNVVMTSPDGVTWTVRTSPRTSAWKSVCWGSDWGTLVAIGTDRVMTSFDGITWTETLLPVSATWQKVAYAPSQGIFVAVASDGTDTRLIRSDDGGNTWYTKDVANYAYYCITYAAAFTRFVAAGDRVLLSGA